MAQGLIAHDSRTRDGASMATHLWRILDQTASLSNYHYFQLTNPADHSVSQWPLGNVPGLWDTIFPSGVRTARVK